MLEPETPNCFFLGIKGHRDSCWGQHRKRICRVCWYFLFVYYILDVMCPIDSVPLDTFGNYLIFRTQNNFQILQFRSTLWNTAWRLHRMAYQTNICIKKKSLTINTMKDTPHKYKQRPTLLDEADFTVVESHQNYNYIEIYYRC